MNPVRIKAELHPAMTSVSITIKKEGNSVFVNDVKVVKFDLSFLQLRLYILGDILKEYYIIFDKDCPPSHPDIKKLHRLLTN